MITAASLTILWAAASAGGSGWSLSGQVRCDCNTSTKHGATSAQDMLQQCIRICIVAMWLPCVSVRAALAHGKLAALWCIGRKFLEMNHC